MLSKPGKVVFNSRLLFFKVYVREQVTPFVSTAELMKKFQTSTRDLSLPHVQNQSRPMTLTRLNEPEFATSQRTRPTRLKSTSELEEELLAKMPKFKARPLNKKVLHGFRSQCLCSVITKFTQRSCTEMIKPEN